MARNSGMHDDISIFQQHWWLDAATGGKWQQIEFCDDPTISLKLIFSTSRKRGLTMIGMPVLARVMRPIINFHSNRPKAELPHVVRALGTVAEMLPKFDIFRYTLPPESGLDLAFCLSGYAVEVTYTYRTYPDNRHDPWKEMDRKVRYNINTGLRRAAVETHGDIDRYVRLSSTFINSRAFKDTMDYEAIRRIWQASHSRNQASILSCVDAKGNDLAAAIVIWDDRHLYYWLSCRDPEANDNTANSLLIWSAIEMAQKAGLVFDADGYASPAAGLFLSRFGLLPARRFNVSMVNSKAQLRMAVASHARSAVGPRLRRQLLAIKELVPSRRLVAQLPEG
jgi:hypothetical protein